MRNRIENIAAQLIPDYLSGSNACRTLVRHHSDHWYSGQCFDNRAGERCGHQSAIRGAVVYGRMGFYCAFHCRVYSPNLLHTTAIQIRIQFLRSYHLLAILPSYISFFIPGFHSLQVIRILRVLRIFRILKLVQFINQSNLLINALLASRLKITIFLFTISTLLVVFGSTMYLIEGPENGFTNIPVSIYWSVVTLTTVGFGDITPKTDLGRAIAAIVMVTAMHHCRAHRHIHAELSQEMRRQNARADKRICTRCRKSGHEPDANYCRICGEELTHLSKTKRDNIH